MKIKWMGTASLMLDAGRGWIAFDPFLGIPYGSLAHPSDNLPDHAERFREAKAVLVTHGHFDHIRDIPRIYRGEYVPVYATKTPVETLIKHSLPKDKLRVIAPGWHDHVEGFTVSAYQGRHCHFNKKIILQTVLRRSFFASPLHTYRLLRLNKEYPENGEILFYELSDGKARVQIMGSLGLDDAEVYPTGADALVLPFQGRSDLTEVALPLVKRLTPKRILLDHYDDAFPPMSSQIPTEDFCKRVQNELSIPCRALTRNALIEII